MLADEPNGKGNGMIATTPETAGSTVAVLETSSRHVRTSITGPLDVSRGHSKDGAVDAEIGDRTGTSVIIGIDSVPERVTLANARICDLRSFSWRP